MLRRAGSSTASSSTLVTDDGEDDDDDNSLGGDRLSERFGGDCSFAAAAPLLRGLPGSPLGTSFLRRWGGSEPLSETAAFQFNGLTEGFRKSGLPWDGAACRSWMAGGSGVLYCLPALFCGGDRLEQCAWILQAVLSVMADYSLIDRDSVVHGVDRCYATFNVLATVYRASAGGTLDLPTVVGAASLPLSCFVMANRAKRRLDLRAWHRWHGAWHLAGAVVVSLIVRVLYSPLPAGAIDGGSGGAEHRQGMPW